MKNRHISVLSVVINGNYKDIIMKKYKVMAFEVLGFMETIKAENKEEAIRIFEELYSKRKLMPDSSEGLDGIEVQELKDWQ